MLNLKLNKQAKEIIKEFNLNMDKPTIVYAKILLKNNFDKKEIFRALSNYQKTRISNKVYNENILRFFRKFLGGNEFDTSIDKKIMSQLSLKDDFKLLLLYYLLQASKILAVFFIVFLFVDKM